jgi:hypothetical protein
MRISIRALMHILDPDPEPGGSLGNGLHLYYLTGVHAANRVIMCSLICNRDVVCGEDTRLDCCDMISTTSEIGIAIIMLGKLYFMVLVARSCAGVGSLP